MNKLKGKHSRRLHLRNFVGEGLGSFKRSCLGPLRLVNTNLVKNRRELVTIFCVIDLLRVGTKDIDTALGEAKGDVLR